MKNHVYSVEVVRSGDWWAITVSDLPGVFSQAKRLDQVEADAREAITLMLDADQDDLTLDVHVTPPETVAGLLEELHAAVVAANEATKAAAHLRREAARALYDEGLPTRDVGRLIGVSHQRVSQLLAT